MPSMPVSLCAPTEITASGMNLLEQPREAGIIQP